MEDELEVRPPYDPEVEKRRIEAYELTQKAAQETQKTIHEGWQKVVNEVTNAIREHMILSKEVEHRSFRNILITVVTLFVGVGLLTWQGIVPAEGFTFLVGAIIGYLLSLSPLARPTSK
ncbi:hypothetical protein M1M86_00710 [Dehalococcoidales bacterium]|nr:hypothetical protein [Dehalococcoidales bacterium]